MKEALSYNDGASSNKRGVQSVRPQTSVVSGPQRGRTFLITKHPNSKFLCSKRKHVRSTESDVKFQVAPIAAPLTTIGLTHNTFTTIIQVSESG